MNLSNECNICIVLSENNSVISIGSFHYSIPVNEMCEQLPIVIQKLTQESNLNLSNIKSYNVNITNKNIHYNTTLRIIDAYFAALLL